MHSISYFCYTHNMKSNELGYYSFSILFTFVLIVLFIPNTGFEWDVISWWSWANWIQEMELKNIYKTQVNYHPIWLYVLYIYGEIQCTNEAIIKNVHTLKNHSITI